MTRRIDKHIGYKLQHRRVAHTISTERLASKREHAPEVIAHETNIRKGQESHAFFIELNTKLGADFVEHLLLRHATRKRRNIARIHNTNDVRVRSLMVQNSLVQHTLASSSAMTVWMQESHEHVSHAPNWQLQVLEDPTTLLGIGVP